MHSASNNRRILYAIIISIQDDLQTLIREQVIPRIASGPLFDEKTDRELVERIIRDSEDEKIPINYELKLSFSDFGHIINCIQRHIDKLTAADQKYFRKIHTKLEKLVSPRNRVMHGRPLEFDDMTYITELSKDLVRSKTDFWHEVRSTISELKNNPEYILSVNIDYSDPEHVSVLHNLPQPDFDDTGFVGRQEKIEEAKRAISGPYPVITIHGQGGIGKTALAIKLCYEILDDPNCQFEAIVWTTAKTSRLTTTEIEQIDGAISDSLGIFDSAYKVLDHDAAVDPVNSVLDLLGSFPILLIIDNLETILDNRIRSFVRRVPIGSKVLFTTRITLGAIDFPIEIEPFTEKEASHYFRRTASVWGQKSLSTLPQSNVVNYVDQLQYSPLFIKWFIQCKASGKSSKQILSNRKDILRFCLENVFDHLDNDCHLVLRILVCTRPPHSQPLLGYYGDIDQTKLQRALTQLISSNIITSRVDRVSSEEHYELSQLARLYILNFLDIDVKMQEQFKRKESLLIQEHALFSSQNYSDSYNLNNITVRDRSDFIVARILREANRLNISKRYEAALAEIKRAEEISPDYFEVQRFKAVTCALLRDYITARECFESALALAPNHAPLYLWYGRFLFQDLNEIEEALQLFQRAIKQDAEATECSIEIARMHLYLRDFQVSREVIGLIDLDKLPEKRKRILIDLLFQTYMRQFEWACSQEEFVRANGLLLEFITAYEQTPKRLIDTRTRDHIARVFPTVRRFSGIVAQSEFADDVRASVRWFQASGFAAVGGGPDVPDEVDDRSIKDASFEQFRKGVICELKESFGFIESLSDRLFFHEGQWQGPSKFEQIEHGTAVYFQLGENHMGACAVRVFERLDTVEWEKERTGIVSEKFETFGFILEDFSKNRYFFHKNFLRKSVLYDDVKIKTKIRFVLGTNGQGVCATDISAVGKK